MGFNEESDEEEFSMAQVLPVASFNNYDPSRPPNSGMDYLRRVQLEASRCPDIVVATIDANKFNKHQTSQFDDNNGFIPCPENLKPTDEWQLQQVAEFAKIRMKITEIRNKLEGHEIQSHFAKYGDFLEEFPKVKRRHIDQQIAFFESRDPLLGIVLQFSQYEIHKLLIDHFKWMQHAQYSYKRGLWIYALLGCLQKPLQSEVYSTLRDISRSCSVHRSIETYTVESEVVKSLNLIICIIGRYFNQLDMID